MSNLARENLSETWKICRQARDWLVRSHGKAPIPPYVDVSGDEWDQLEALSGRFARLTDLVIHKLFRALDRYELEDVGTIVDSSNRAVKRGIISSVDTLRDFKDLRNEIVHEYLLEDLGELYASIYSATPKLLELIQHISEYLGEKHGIS